VNAERQSVTPSLERHSHASMRPRFCERGKQRLRVPALARRSASMRPRFCERGKMSVVAQVIVDDPCFNEAAFL
jgi:hypothetical protein